MVALLVIGPFAAFVVWSLIDERLSKSVVPPARDEARSRRLNRLTVVVGWILVVGYGFAVFSGWLKTRSAAEGIVVLVGMLGFALLGTRRSVRESAGADEGRQIRQVRLALVMLVAFGAILGIAGWLSASHGVH